MEEVANKGKNIAHRSHTVALTASVLLCLFACVLI